jgi:cysteine desulfurase
VPAIVGFGMAAELAQKEMKDNEKQIRNLRDELEAELLQIDGTTVNGSATHRLYNVSNICFQGVDSEALILGLGAQEPMIAVSNGSACTSAVVEPSHVLIALGLHNDAAFSSIRFSLGKPNTNEELKTLFRKLKTILPVHSA